MSDLSGYDWSEVDARTRTRPSRRRASRRGSAMLAASLLAVGELLDPEEPERVVEESPDPGLDPSLPVVVHLVRGAPRLSYAVVR